MNNVQEIIRKRRSVRSYSGAPLSENEKEKLTAFAKTIENPFNLKVEFKLLNAKEHGLVCPVVSGTELFVGGKIENLPYANAAFGYSFEALVLYSASLSVGTVWLGGTMNRDAFEKAMELKENEMMPCASALGFEAKKMTIRETMMRKAIKADERLDFEEIFYENNFNTPLKKENAGVFLKPLEMVRLAPSAVNKQPWRVIIENNAAHFYLKRSKGFSHQGKLDMQMIDLGIALCHFDLTLKEMGINAEFKIDREKLLENGEAEYLASYIIK